MLPELKKDFPKCLYLDQNKWMTYAGTLRKAGGNPIPAVP